MATQLTFWICVVLLAHTYLGYPLLVLALARWRPRPVRSRGTEPTVTAVMAVHNGADHMAAKLANLLALEYPRQQLRVVVVCDGCTDASATLCEAFADQGVSVIEVPERCGKAACLNTGIAGVDSEILLLTDVRQRIEASALRALLTELGDPAVGAVSGELRFDNAEQGFARNVDAYWRYETTIRRAESDSGSAVGVSGALYAMRRELFQPLPVGTVLDDVLVPMRVARAGKRVRFAPAARAFDRASTEPGQERARKIRTLAGNYQLLRLAPWLLNPWRNPLWFRFVSHKVLRLLAPWLLLLMLILSAFLASTHLIYALSLAALLGCIALVVLGRVLPSLAGWFPVRLSTAFCYLNLYSAQALIVFARNRHLHLW